MNIIRLFFHLFGKTVPTFALTRASDPQENILHLIALLIVTSGLIAALYLGYSLGDIQIFGLALLILAALDMTSYFILKFEDEESRKF